LNSKVEEVIRDIPELSHGFLSMEPLRGGLCNQTYRIHTKQSIYVLRINSRQNEYLNLTRRSEVEVMKKAHQEGLAPKVYPTIPEQYVVTEYIEGRCWRKTI
jgi:aminoglycoside phosphotransferase (APT) family kinase protein